MNSKTSGIEKNEDETVNVFKLGQYAVECDNSKFKNWDEFEDWMVNIAEKEIEDPENFRKFMRYCRVMGGRVKTEKELKESEDKGKKFQGASVSVLAEIDGIDYWVEWYLMEQVAQEYDGKEITDGYSKDNPFLCYCKVCGNLWKSVKTVEDFNNGNQPSRCPSCGASDWQESEAEFIKRVLKTRRSEEETQSKNPKKRSSNSSEKTESDLDVTAKVKCQNCDYVWISKYSTGEIANGKDPECPNCGSNRWAGPSNPEVEPDLIHPELKREITELDEKLLRKGYVPAENIRDKRQGPD